MSTMVPMSHPATAVKNPDGTWSVRIQHTAEGSVTTVDFTNLLFAEVLAKAYADTLNGKAAVEAKLGQIATDLGPAVSDAKADVKQVIADAEAEARKLIGAAKAEAGKIRDDAVTLVQSAEAEAVTLKAEAGKALSAAKTEAAKLLNEARDKAAEILKAAEKAIRPAQPPAAPPPAAPKPTVEDE